MGIRRTYSGGLIGGLAPFLIVDAMRKALRENGVREVEMSWILEDNRPMRHMIESLGARAYKTYRVYEKRIAAWMARLTALVLAGTRAGGDPLAEYAGVSHKALIEVGGRTMVERVVEALAAAPEVERIVVAIERPELLEGLPGLRLRAAPSRSRP